MPELSKNVFETWSISIGSQGLHGDTGVKLVQGVVLPSSLRAAPFHDIKRTIVKNDQMEAISLRIRRKDLRRCVTKTHNLQSTCFVFVFLTKIISSQMWTLNMHIAFTECTVLSEKLRDAITYIGKLFYSSRCCPRDWQSPDLGMATLNSVYNLGFVFGPIALWRSTAVSLWCPRKPVFPKWLPSMYFNFGSKSETGWNPRLQRCQKVWLWNTVRSSYGAPLHRYDGWRNRIRSSPTQRWACNFSQTKILLAIWPENFAKCLSGDLSLNQTVKVYQVFKYHQHAKFLNKSSFWYRL